MEFSFRGGMVGVYQSVFRGVVNCFFAPSVLLPAKLVCRLRAARCKTRPPGHSPDKK
jgi:hypothetical protein